MSDNRPINEKSIAEILQNWYLNHPVNEHCFGDLVGEFVWLFEDANPRFDAEKFISNCGLKEEVSK